MIKRYKTNSTHRKFRTRLKLKKVSQRPRLTVFRSNKTIYAQIIDDKKHHTLVSASPSQLENNSGSKSEVAVKIGQLIAKKALKVKIKTVVFDRGQYKYHGRVKALAESAKKAGLIF